jgi:hypothetical protein
LVGSEQRLLRARQPGRQLQQRIGDIRVRLHGLRCMIADCGPGARLPPPSWCGAGARVRWGARPRWMLVCAVPDGK